METTAGAAVGVAEPAESQEGNETTEEDEMRTWVEEYAKKNGWVLNPDKKILDTVIRGLVRNKRKFGEQYCPCRLVRGQGEGPGNHLPMHLPQR